jgi:hypothetical protein
MAASARASARVSSFSESSVTCDDIDSLHAVHRAYVCLEKLIVPQRVNDAEDVYPTRAELGALVRLVNEELQRRIEAAEATIQSWRVAAGEGGAQ